ncbi:APC family permease [Cyanobium sp. Alchichica 3B3-8F6]|uniref:APC family permease n=1 Tax=Cyanobium sp. Alchichica 3B3-8F6 TaxID=2823696 RepID=UPI0020CCD991|nr:APC family permease [Cyanobium sp. Alchichica 3B3-8F6]MCP9881742.1 APC family permease [Cyanobium sp. Alchichica 3B3-8F6]
MSQPAPGRLLDILGLGFGLAGAVGGTIGAGILRTPGLVAAQLPSPALVLAVWLAGGVYALLGAVCIAELAAALPQAGGWYVYAERAFGRQVGFLVGWTDWLAHCIGLAWVATTVGDYGLALLPADLLPAGMPLEGSISKGLALLAIGLFSLIQLRGLRAGSTSQELLSLAKAVAFLALVAACFLLPIPTAAPIAPPTPEPMTTLGWRNLSLAVVLALQAVITTYDGWASPVYFAEEFSEPGRDLPRSLIGGVLAVLVLYLLINLALLHVLPIAQLANSSLPAAAAALALAGPLGAVLITAIALVSLLGLINTVVMAAPRILFGLSRDGLLPSAVAAVNGGGTPAVALLITSTAAAALVLAGSFERLLAMGAVLYVSLPLAGIAALLALRRQEPNLPRPFRTWGYPLTPLLVAAVSLAYLVGTALGDWVDSLAALVLVALGYAASRLIRVSQAGS